MDDASNQTHQDSNASGYLKSPQLLPKYHGLLVQKKSLDYEEKKFHFQRSPITQSSLKNQNLKSKRNSQVSINSQIEDSAVRKKQLIDQLSMDYSDFSQSVQTNRDKVKFPQLIRSRRLLKKYLNIEYTVNQSQSQRDSADLPDIKIMIPKIQSKRENSSLQKQSSAFEHLENSSVDIKSIQNFLEQTQVLDYDKYHKMIINQVRQKTKKFYMESPTKNLDQFVFKNHQIDHSKWRLKQLRKLSKKKLLVVPIKDPVMVLTKHSLNPTYNQNYKMKLELWRPRLFQQF